MRFLLRFLSLVFLAAAVIVGIIDSIQSVAGETVALTPFGSALFTINPKILGLTEAYVRGHLSPALWDVGAEWLLQQPAFAVFLALSLMLYAIAYKREQPGGLTLRPR
jgi:hypothetical protein